MPNTQQKNSDANVPQTGPQQIVERDSIRYTILGTAHVSRQSAEEVKNLIASDEFDAVAIELCEARHHALTNPDAVQKMDLIKVIREGKVGMIAASLALGAFQRRIADQFGIEPGAEMSAAISGTQQQNIPLVLVDRDVGITLKRVYKAVPWYQRMMLMSGMVTSLFTSEDIEEEDIERLKQGDILESTFSEFANSSAPMYNALIAERDDFMASRLRQEFSEKPQNKAIKNVLVVIGAGHLQGLAKQLTDDQRATQPTIDALNVTPPKSNFLKALPWIIVAVLLSGFSLAFARSPDLGLQVIAEWVLINGTLCALGATIAGAHPITIIIGFVSAPLTSLNPTVGAGMVTASVEVWKRKPKVADFANLRDDVTSLKGWRKNLVAKTFLVFILSNLGSAIGTWLAGFRIFGLITR